MPTYDYVCPKNGRVLSVFHAMSERIATWGELCDRAPAEVGETDRTAPVERLIGTGHVLAPKSGKDLGFGGGGCCSGQSCNC